MDFYIASTITNKKTVKYIIDKLLELCHNVTVDWTDDNSISESERECNVEEMKRIAHRDFEGVMSCDVFVLLTDPSDGRSMYVELGIALASQVLRGFPTTYVLGSMSNQSVFYYHDAVRKVQKIEDILEQEEEGVMEDG